VLKRAEDRLRRLERFEPRLSSADLIFSEERSGRFAEAVLSIDGEDRVFAKGEGPEFRAAVDVMLDRLSRILRKQRERRTDHQAAPRQGVLDEPESEAWPGDT
jgi:ribosomal subunit interface protein